MVWPRTIGTTFEERGRRLTGPNKNAAGCYRKVFGYSFGLGNRKCGERPREAVEQFNHLVFAFCHKRLVHLLSRLLLPGISGPNREPLSDRRPARPRATLVDRKKAGM
jgi:hypothetical protein